VRVFSSRQTGFACRSSLFLGEKEIVNFPESYERLGN